MSMAEKNVSRIRYYLALVVQRCSSSPILIGLLSIAVLWTAIFMAASNLAFLRKMDRQLPTTGWVDAPPAPRNLAFEKRIGLVKHPHDCKVEDDKLDIKLASATHGFNVEASEKIGPQIRTLPDTVPEMCRQSQIDSPRHTFPTASVIISFHNEHFITLARTVMSVLHRTPERILEEIILVDDGSDDAGLIAKVSEMLTQSIVLSKTKLIRLDQHAGIVAARLRGANEAKGKVLIFMESHAEPNVEWIEPLLSLIESGKKKGDSITIAVPVIDIIDDETFKYRASPALRGGFDWDLVFRWEFTDDKSYQSVDGVYYIQSPTFSGGVFAVDREQFFALGSYDESMHEWGAENIELSLRAGMCGGRVLVTPCSRVGHVFRRKLPMQIQTNRQEHDSTYWFAFNALRTAKVWLVDEGENDGNKYLSYFFSAIPEARRVDDGNVAARKNLRKQLKCHTFKWFLENLYPDFPQAPSSQSNEPHRLNLERPVDSLTNDKESLDNLDGYIRKSRRSGHLFHVVSGMCLTSCDSPPIRNVPANVLPGNASSFNCLKLATCEHARAQLWFETWQGDFILDGAGGGCLTFSGPYSPAALISVCPPVVIKPQASDKKYIKSTKWRWLDGMTSSQLQIVLENSPLNEKCLIARHFPTMCDNGRCGNSTASARTDTICKQADQGPSEVLVEPCTADHNQLFQLLDFTKETP